MQITRVGIPVPLASPGTVTISNANPAVVTKGAHGLAANTPISFSCSFAAGDVLPAPLVEGKQYYVASTGLNAGDFGIAEYPNGPRIATTSAGQGTFTCNVEFLRVNCADLKYLGVLIRNRGANALNLCDTYFAFKSEHAYGPAHDQAVRIGNISEIKGPTAAADYTTTPVYPLTQKTVSPVTLASGAAAWMVFDVSGIAQLSMRATISVAAGTIDVEAIGKSY